MGTKKRIEISGLCPICFESAGDCVEGSAAVIFCREGETFEWAHKSCWDDAPALQQRVAAHNAKWKATHSG